MAPAQAHQGGGALPTGQERVRLLYEEYIHAKWVMQVWEQPVSDKPELEPVVAAAIHGIELAFLLLAQFITDTRRYVSKRPRVEAMALNIRAQVQLLADMIDGELEEEGQPCSTTLTQGFPFEGCPPTTQAPAESPGLTHLIRAVQQAKAIATVAELNSMVKVGLLITSAFQAAFQRWTVGLGIEHQLNQLLGVLGVQGATVRERGTNLDYRSMFRPQVVEATLTQETYTNAEDFFFRSVHLGTECWMFVASSRARSAHQHACQGNWDIASARVMQASRVLRYLGEHVLSLTRMNLRDYLQLKVQLEGTSGAGSSLVRGIRPLLLALMEPLADHARRLAAEAAAARGGAAGGGAAEDAGADEALLQGLTCVYTDCEEQAGLYNYAKALEDVESALLGGFYHSHYVLATNVIGSEARGTMRRAVAALKATYEKPLFPVLDAVRCQMGVRFDQQLAPIKGRMMDDILARYASQSSGDTNDQRLRSLIPPAVLRAGSYTPDGSHTPHQQQHHAARAAAIALASAGATSVPVTASASAGPTVGSHPLEGGRDESPEPEDMERAAGGCPFFGGSSPEPAAAPSGQAAPWPLGQLQGASTACPFASLSGAHVRSPATPVPGEAPSVRAETSFPSAQHGAQR